MYIDWLVYIEFLVCITLTFCVASANLTILIEKAIEGGYIRLIMKHM